MNKKFNYSKLRGRIVEKYGTVSAFADAIGDNLKSVSRALCRRRFLRDYEIIDWCKALGITPAEIHKYFFTLDVEES